ncbi:MAG: rod shape-determining protein MreD [Gemmatimonadota bacterium]
MRRLLLSALVLLGAVLLQIVAVNSLPLPGGSSPDLVLVAIAALAVTGGPMEGALAGFAGGLALDIAPPAVHLVGQQALVFCLIGYAAGRLAGPLEGTAWLRLAVVAVAAAAGEALQAALGLMFSEPDYTWSAARQVLPAALVYECALSPFVLAIVAGLRERLGAFADAPVAMGGELAARTKAAASPLAGLAGISETVRSTGAGRTPRLRAAAGRPADGWIGSHPAAGGQMAQRRPLNLRLRGGQAGSAAAVPVSRSLPARPVNLRLGSRRRGDRIPGAAVAVGALGDARALLPGARPRAGSFRGGRSAARQAGTGFLARAQPRAGSFRGGPSAARASGAAFSGKVRPRSGSFRGGPAAARRPGAFLSKAPRKGAFSGGPSAARRAPAGLAGGPARLRIGSRRGDGVVGGSVTGLLGRRRGMKLVSGRAATPRFRSGSGLTGRRGRRGGLGGGGLTGGLPGTRLPGRRLRLGRAGRRSRVWRIGSKRTGGLS